MEKRMGRIATSTCVASATLLGSSVCFAQSTLSMSVHQTVHAGVMSPVYVQTVENAVCSLHPRDTSDPTLTMRLFTDDRDIVQFQITLNSVGDVEHLVMDCSSNDGLGPHITHSIEVRAVPVQDPVLSDTDSLKDVPYPGVKVPPLKAHQLNLSNAELMARGYPVRPDPSTMPAQYERWKEIVSRSWTIAEPRHAAHRWDEVPTYRTISAYSPNSTIWEGYEMHRQVTCGSQVIDNPRFWYVEGQFAAPSARTGLLSATSRMSEWIGIGDAHRSATTSLMQAGADLTVVCGQYSCSSSISLWKDALPDSMIGLPSLSTLSGDWLELSIIMVDNNGNPSASGSNGYLWMYNATRGIAINSLISLSAGFYNYSYAGESAVWIIERVGDTDCTRSAHSNLCAFADFASSQMKLTSAAAAGCSSPLSYLQPGNMVDPQTLFSCDVDPNCPNLARVDPGTISHGGRADMTFTWLNYQ